MELKEPIRRQPPSYNSIVQEPHPPNATGLVASFLPAPAEEENGDNDYPHGINPFEGIVIEGYENATFTASQYSASCINIIKVISKTFRTDVLCNYVMKHVK